MEGLGEYGLLRAELFDELENGFSAKDVPEAALCNK